MAELLMIQKSSSDRVPEYLDAEPRGTAPVAGARRFHAQHIRRRDAFAQGALPAVWAPRVFRRQGRRLYGAIATDDGARRLCNSQLAMDLRRLFIAGRYLRAADSGAHVRPRTRRRLGRSEARARLVCADPGATIIRQGILPRSARAHCIRFCELSCRRHRDRWGFIDVRPCPATKLQHAVRIVLAELRIRP